MAHSRQGEMARNLRLYPWFKFFQGLYFWHAVWFLYFQSELSAAEAVLLYAIYDVGALALEVPSGYMSDRLGRRVTLIAATASGLAGAMLLGIGGSLPVFALGQVLIGAGMAFMSGTDSALLYESLAADGRSDQIEREELRAWRAGFAASAMAGLAGGGMALSAAALPFWASAAASAGALVIALRFAEPDSATPKPTGGELARLGGLGRSFLHPVLVWLFVLNMAMYILGHVPFVFGQPFILATLESLGLAGEAPLVSGGVSATMMAVSLLASLVVVPLRRRLGLPLLLLVAFAIQILLCAALALSGSLLALALLFLRMVPDALSWPLILARIQPLLSSASRATYLSLQSFSGRMIFAGTLLFAADAIPGEGQMDQGALATVLGAYTIAGLVVLGLLAVALLRVRIEQPPGA